MSKHEKHQTQEETVDLGPDTYMCGICGPSPLSTFPHAVNGHTQETSHNTGIVSPDIQALVDESINRTGRVF